MTLPLRSDPAASEELAAAVEWYEEQRPGLGAEFFDAVVAMVTLIEAHSELGSPAGADPQTRRMLVPRFPYAVIYRLRATEIVIVAVAHLKRTPGYWKQRN